MSHILRTAKKKVRDLPSTHLSVVNCALAGTLPAEAESLRPLQGRLNKILDRDHTQLRPRAPDPSGRPVTFDFTAGDVDSDDEGEDDDFTAERILADKPDPGTPGGRLYKVRWKGFAASRDSREPPSSFVPRYTTVWMDYLKKKNISLDVKDVLVHLVAAVAP